MAKYSGENAVRLSSETNYKKVFTKDVVTFSLGLVDLALRIIQASVGFVSTLCYRSVEIPGYVVFLIFSI